MMRRVLTIVVLLFLVILGAAYFLVRKKPDEISPDNLQAAALPLLPTTVPSGSPSLGNIVGSLAEGGLAALGESLLPGAAISAAPTLAGTAGAAVAPTAAESILSSAPLVGGEAPTIAAGVGESAAGSILPAGAAGAAIVLAAGAAIGYGLVQLGNVLLGGQKEEPVLNAQAYNDPLYDQGILKRGGSGGVVLDPMTGKPFMQNL